MICGGGACVVYYYYYYITMYLLGGGAKPSGTGDRRMHIDTPAFFFLSLSPLIYISPPRPQGLFLEAVTVCYM